MEAPALSQPLRATASTIPRKPLPSQNLAYVSVSLDEGSPPRNVEEKKWKLSKNWKLKNKNWKLVKTWKPGVKWKPDQNKWKRRFKSCVPKYAWAPEIASMLLASSMLIAILILLSMRQDKPLPTWPTLLGINSLVAIFSAVFKVALLFPIVEGISELKWIWFADARSVNDFDRFDSASRGPWGAARLLIARRSDRFASLGAIITILALGIDPFTQQVLHFYTCRREIKGSTATIARANVYTQINGAGLASYADAKLTGAVYQGLLNPSANATVDIPTYCPSGNCTFTPSKDVVAYSSLEICSAVKDISQSVKGNTSGLGSAYATWDFRLPSGLNISSAPDGSNGVVLANWVHDVDFELPGRSRPDDTSAPLTLEVLMWTTDCDDPFTKKGPHQCSIRPLAFEILIAPCVVQYGYVNISNSIFGQTAISRTFLSHLGLGYQSVGTSSSFPDIDCSGSRTRHGNYTAKTTTVKDDSGDWHCAHMPQLAYPPCGGDEGEILWYDPACIFYFGDEAASGLGNILATVLADGTEPEANGPYVLMLSQWRPLTTWQNDLQQWLAPLWNSGHASVSSVSKTMDAITGALNVVIRKEAGQAVPARGAILENRTCVGVEWAWIALPCALLVLTLIFLVSTIFILHKMIKYGSIQDRRKPWKSSTLPLLWCGLQDDTRARVGPLNDVDMMEEYGEGIEVALGRGDGGRWKLGETAYDDTGNNSG